MSSRSWRRAVLAAVILIVGVAPYSPAAPALTVVEDKLYRADGSKFAGVVFIEWKSFESDVNTIPASSITVRVTEGLLRVALAPTTTASPAAYYRVHFNSNGQTDFVEYWSVRPSASNLRLRDIRIPGPLSVSQTPVPPINTAILIPDVSGLRDELDARPSKGSGYMAGRAAVVNSDGEIESALGRASDCVHVDGSSGPCGGGGGVSFVDAETPAGVVDGANATFTLADIPVPGTSLRIYRNGLLQRLHADYTLTGAELTLLTGAIPQSGDILSAYYRVPDAMASNASFVDDETPGGVIDGVNRSFVVATNPYPAASLRVYRNGLLLKSGSDYDVEGTVISFLGTAIPQTGDALQVAYRY